MANPIVLTARDHDQNHVFRGSKAGASAVLGPERLTQLQESVWYLVWSPEAVGGEVVLEGAPEVSYAGTWAVLHRFPWVSGGRAQWAAITGPHLALRVRITRSIVNGEVDCYGIGN